MLKFEGYVIGDRIRGYDFEPIDDLPNRYIEGEIVDIYDEDFKAYVIKVDYDSNYRNYSRVGDVIRVPMQTTFDFDGRVAGLN